MKLTNSFYVGVASGMIKAAGIKDVFGGAKKGLGDRAKKILKKHIVKLMDKGVLPEKVVRGVSRGVSGVTGALSGGLSGAATGMVSGAVADKENRVRGAMLGGLSGGVLGAGAGGAAGAIPKTKRFQGPMTVGGLRSQEGQDLLRKHLSSVAGHGALRGAAGVPVGFLAGQALRTKKRDQ